MIKNLFSNNLEEKNLQTNKPRLIKILENNGYKFSWYSNSIKDCATTNKSLCGETKKILLIHTSIAMFP